MSETSYVVIFFDRYDESSISFVVGPFPDLAEAQEAVRETKTKIAEGYRQHSIQRCRPLDSIPEWEIRA